MQMAGPLPQFHYDSSAFDPEDAFSIWHEQLATVFDVDLGDREAVNEFRGTLTAYHMGTLLLARSASHGQAFSRDHRTIAQSSADHYLIQLYLKGGYVGTTGQDDIDLCTGDVSVLDMARPVKTRASDFEIVTLCVPRDVLAPLVGLPDQLHGTVLRGDTATGAMLADHMRSLYRNAGTLTATDAPAVAQGTAALVAGCLGPALAARDVVQPAMQTARLSAIRRHVEKHLADPDIGPDQICREFGMSRANLYRLFEPLGGVNAYIRERRLARAFVDLISPAERRRIGDIGYDWGFGSEASFSRAFRTAFGMSPRDVRAASASLSSLLADSGITAPANSELGRWIRTLGGG